ncbi:MAG: 6-bladed beta-propeller [Dysgonamonadaceae bacterium]|jgi:hypothetical protein|nr:6-bladed beta-propeller [Dysgonamonadaceae bacterium]
MKKIFLLLYLFGLFACDKNSKVEHYKSFAIDLKDKKDFIDMSFLVDSVHLVKLETNDDALIARILKINIDDNYIYIQDRRHKILVYAQTGHFKYMIDRIGTGPGEYTRITDFCITENFIEIIDIQTKKLLRYDKNGGEFVKAFKFEPFVYCLFPINNGMYLSDLPLNVGDGKFGVYLLDSLYNEKKHLLQYSGDYPIFGQNIGIFSEIKQDLFGVYSQVENAVYHYSYPNMEKKYSFEIKDKLKLKSKKGTELLQMSDSERERLCHASFYKENNMFLLLSVLEKMSPITIIYNKLTEEISMSNVLSCNFMPLFFPAISDTPNIIVYYVPTEMFVEMKGREDIKQNMKNKEFLDMANIIEEDDNPVLQILYMKK